MTVSTRRLTGNSCPEVDISDLVYTYYKQHFKKTSIWQDKTTKSV